MPLSRCSSLLMVVMVILDVTYSSDTDKPAYSSEWVRLSSFCNFTLTFWLNMCESKPNLEGGVGGEFIKWATNFKRCNSDVQMYKVTLTSQVPSFRGLEQVAHFS